MELYTLNSSEQFGYILSKVNKEIASIKTDEKTNEIPVLNR
jgi:hypothetical protein